LAFNGYVSVMVQNASFDKILPMVLQGEDGSTGSDGDYIYEPDGGEILSQLLPKSLRTRIFQSFLETQAGEQASRMIAMDAATRNAGDLIDQLTLDYNRARQAAITKELIEIVSGAEAL
jgi:F-type H+-transporting ATPase subunit gamma